MKVKFQIKPKKGILRLPVVSNNFEITDEFLEYLDTLGNKDRKVLLVQDKAFEWFLENYDFHLTFPEEVFS